MVAKSFQTFIQECEPYVLNGKMYVNVRNPKNNNVRTVRWYSEKEYTKMYPEAKIQDTKAEPRFKSQKEALGFEKGYITIFKGDTYSNLEWYQSSSARYSKWWGWYFISTDEVPADVPNEPIQLPWESVGNAEGCLLSDEKVKAAVEALTYEKGTSEFQGTIGERIEISLYIKQVIQLDTAYGVSCMHIMEDENGNEYVWTTASKCWPTGETKLVRGTIKEHKMFRNQCQTVLTRCLER